MEQIIFGLLSSSPSDQTAKKFFKHVKKKPKEIFFSMNEEQKKFFWVTCLHFYSIGNEDQKTQARNLHKIFISTCWENFGYVVSLEDIQTLLTNGNINNMYDQVHWPLEKSNDDFLISFVILFLDFLLDIFENIPKTVEVINIHDGCANAVKGFCVKIIYYCETPEDCAKVCKFFTINTNCIDNQKSQAICNILIKKVGGFSIQGRIPAQIKKLCQDVHDIMNLLKTMWSMNEKLFFSTIQELFRILTDKTDHTPSIALAGITEVVPTNTLTPLFEQFLQSSIVDNAMLTKAFKGIVHWLPWPGAARASNTKIWILSLLVCLKQGKNFVCLVDVIYNNASTVFKFIKYPNIRLDCTGIIEVMLLAYQHTPDAFHLILPLIPQTIKDIKTENHSNMNEECLTKLNKLIQCLMFKFSGFPKEYAEIWDVLKDFPIIEDIVIAKCLENSSWITPTLPTISSEMYYHTDLSSRSTITNKAGLVNLGNTCFANSVIQVLYHAKGFVQLVLQQTEQSSSNSIHAAMAETFAFLETTSREAYEPKQLLLLTKPPWFVSGMQQDCSEYVKYVFDKIEHEESNSYSLSSSFMHCKPKIPKIIEREVSMDSACDSENGTASIMSQTTQIVGDIASSSFQTNTVTMEKLFTGKMSINTQCLNCKSISSRSENFVDISLSLYNDSNSDEKESSSGLKGGALPHLDMASTSQVPSNSNITKSTHKFDDLLDDYLKDEILDGENKYHCNTCESLQTASKSLELEELPRYLFFTVMRFTYDKVLQTRTKILDSIEIKPFIYLPLKKGKPSVCYKLCGVIIHSGSSADSGHYYSYTCSTDGKFFESSEENSNDQWYLFNDSTTSMSDLQSIQKSCERFERDTVYMLLYAKMDQAPYHYKFSDTLINHVLEDNENFEKEKEKQSQRRYEQNNTVENLPNFSDNDDDDNNDYSLKPCGGQMDLGSGRMIF